MLWFRIILFVLWAMIGFINIVLSKQITKYDYILVWFVLMWGLLSNIFIS
jgi:hypothetical protein